jgi:hypothetical protein
MRLEEALPDKPGVRLRLAIAGTVGAGVCDVVLGGVTVDDVPYLIAPTLDDPVHVLQDGEKLLVLGPKP